ncbi:hypothetical protein B0H14DRAFT_2723720, partial [Mycena olivaceomarginata]
IYVPILIWILVFLRLSLFTLSTVLIDTTMVESLITSAWVVGVANDLLITSLWHVHKRTMALADKIIAWTIGLYFCLHLLSFLHSYSRQRPE